MQVTVADAEKQFMELIKRAEAGEEIFLTRHGHSVIRLVPVEGTPDRTSRRALLHAVRMSGAANATQGPTAARSQDFLYSDDGMPR